MQFGLIAHWAGEGGFAIWLIGNLQWRKPFSPFIVNIILDPDLVNRWQIHDSLVFRLAAEVSACFLISEVSIFISLSFRQEPVPLRLLFQQVPANGPDQESHPDPQRNTGHATG
jgi:hypothetical protein